MDEYEQELVMECSHFKERKDRKEGEKRQKGRREETERNERKDRGEREKGQKGGTIAHPQVVRTQLDHSRSILRIRAVISLREGQG